MRSARTPVVALSLIMQLLAGCGDGGDRLAFCGNEDRDGWRLTAVERDDAGNLIACTYQAPDGSDSYTVRP